MLMRLGHSGQVIADAPLSNVAWDVVIDARQGASQLSFVTQKCCPGSSAHVALSLDTEGRAHNRDTHCQPQTDSPGNC